MWRAVGLMLLVPCHFLKVQVASLSWECIWVLVSELWGKVPHWVWRLLRNRSLKKAQGAVTASGHGGQTRGSWWAPPGAPRDLACVSSWYTAWPGLCLLQARAASHVPRCLSGTLTLPAASLSMLLSLMHVRVICALSLDHIYPKWASGRLLTTPEDYQASHLRAVVPSLSCPGSY